MMAATTEDLEKPTGVYKNLRLMHACTTVVGLTVHVQTKDGTVMEGIFNTFNPGFTISLELAVQIDPKLSTKDCLYSALTKDQAQAKKQVFIDLKDIVRITAFDVDINYAAKESQAQKLATDADISGFDGSKLGEHKQLEFWQDEDGDNINDETLLSLDDSASGNKSNSQNSRGWDAEEMFDYNAKVHKVNSTYDEQLHDYTIPLPKNDSKEWRKKQERAAAIAKEIETNVKSQNRLAKEDGSDCEEEKFSAVHRPVPNPRANSGSQNGTHSRNFRNPRFDRSRIDSLKNFGKRLTIAPSPRQPQNQNIGPGQNQMHGSPSGQNHPHPQPYQHQQPQPKPQGQPQQQHQQQPPQQHQQQQSPQPPSHQQHRQQTQQQRPHQQQSQQQQPQQPHHHHHQHQQTHQQPHQQQTQPHSQSQSQSQPQPQSQSQTQPQPQPQSQPQSQQQQQPQLQPQQSSQQQLSPAQQQTQQSQIQTQVTVTTASPATTGATSTVDTSTISERSDASSLGNQANNDHQSELARKSTLNPNAKEFVYKPRSPAAIHGAQTNGANQASTSGAAAIYPANSSPMTQAAHAPYYPQVPIFSHGLSPHQQQHHVAQFMPNHTHLHFQSQIHYMSPVPPHFAPQQMSSRYIRGNFQNYHHRGGENHNNVRAEYSQSSMAVPTSAGGQPFVPSPSGAPHSMNAAYPAQPHQPLIYSGPHPQSMYPVVQAAGFPQHMPSMMPNPPPYDGSAAYMPSQNYIQ